MVLNYIWIAFFLIAFVVAVGETVFNGNLDIWSEIMNSSFGAAETAFTISLGLTGILSLWMGLMKIGERCSGWILIRREKQRMEKAKTRKIKNQRTSRRKY